MFVEQARSRWRGKEVKGTYHFLLEIDIDHLLDRISNVNQLEKLYEWSDLVRFSMFLGFVRFHLFDRALERRNDMVLPQDLQQDDKDFFDRVSYFTTISPGVPNERLNPFETVTIGLNQLESDVEREEELHPVEMTLGSRTRRGSRGLRRCESDGPVRVDRESRRGAITPGTRGRFERCRSEARNLDRRSRNCRTSFCRTRCSTSSKGSESIESSRSSMRDRVETVRSGFRDDRDGEQENFRETGQDVLLDLSRVRRSEEGRIRSRQIRSSLSMNAREGCQFACFDPDSRYFVERERGEELTLRSHS
jgi:hypothetical protein